VEAADEGASTRPTEAGNQQSGRLVLSNEDDVNRLLTAAAESTDFHSIVNNAATSSLRQ
jgi:hypothetical protein